MRCHPCRSTGFGLPHLYVHNDAALCSRSGIETSQSSVGAGSAQSCWPASRRLDAAHRMAKLRWRWAIADASRAHARRIGSVVHQNSQARSRVPCRRIAGLAARCRAGIRLAARRARVDQSQPQRAEFMDGARLCGHGDARGHDALGRARHHGPLEVFGAPDIDARAAIKDMLTLAPQWLRGCRLRNCWFEPTFHKHVGKLCNGVQIHTEGPDYDHQAFKPWRVQALAFKAIRRLYPDYPLWRDFAYEYEQGKLAIDVINGGPLLRDWVDDARATPQDLDTLAIPDEQAWLSQRQGYLCY